MTRAAPTSPLELLRDHIGHRTVIREPRPGQTLEIKCVDCTRIIDLTSVFGLRPSSAKPTSTSTAQPPTRRDPQGDEQCPAHVGEWRENCRCCAAEAKALPDGTDRPPTTRTGTDPTQHPDWIARKAQLAARNAARRLAQRTAAMTPPTATVDATPSGGGDTDGQNTP